MNFDIVLRFYFNARQHLDRCKTGDVFVGPLIDYLIYIIYGTWQNDTLGK